MSRSSIRQHVWPGDKASARDVGENVNDLDRALSKLVRLRIVERESEVYASPISFMSDSGPKAVMCISVADSAGERITTFSVPTSFTWNGTEVRVSISGLTEGSVYRSITLLVVE